VKLVATRVYDLDDQTCVDLLFANGESYKLFQSPVDGDLGGWTDFSCEQATQWVHEAPEQLL
jgi:hypothetical protein